MQTKPTCFIVQDMVAKNFLFSFTTQKVPFLGLKMERDEFFFLFVFCFLFFFKKKEKKKKKHAPMKSIFA